jgi:hypothetical protein
VPRYDHAATNDQIRKENQANCANGGVTLHQTFTDPETGNIVDVWCMEAKDQDGRTYQAYHRLGGLPARTERNQKGIVVTEEYSELVPLPEGRTARGTSSVIQTPVFARMSSGGGTRIPRWDMGSEG